MSCSERPQLGPLALTEAARALLPEPCAVLLAGNGNALSGFSDEEGKELVSLLTRLLANLDRIAMGMVASEPPGMPPA